MPTLKLTKAIAVAAAIGAVASLSLAGCTSSTTTKTTDSSSCSTMKSGSTSDAVKVSGKVGAAPKVTFTKGLSATTSEKTTVDKGKGRVVQKNDLVILQATLYDGTTGKKATATDYTTGGTYLQAGPSTNLAALTKGLVCSRVGDRIVVVGTPKDSTDGKGISSLKIGAKDSVVFVADVLKAFPSRATGTKQTPVSGQPTVTLAKDGEPTITIPKDAKAPTKLESTTLIKGSGAKVKTGDNLFVQYTGALYSNGKVFDSSWAKKQPFEFPFSQGQVIQGWIDGLAGKTVGSQVLLVIPPKEGYGSTAQASIPANSTLVFVVDILGKVS